MDKHDWLKDWPTRRIKPVDGMAVTAAVWEEAHDYHRQQRRLHAALSHRPGIVAGLEVIASDPPDSSVYVRPGVAVDWAGDTIVLDEPVAYDLGAAQGLLYLVLSYEESRPRRSRGQEEGPLYIHAQFGLEATPAPPQAGGIELARIRRQPGPPGPVGQPVLASGPGGQAARGAPIVNAQDAARPGPNEIDQRFRQAVGAVPQAVASLAVCYLGRPPAREHGRGATNLARAIRRAGEIRAWVDDDVPLAPGLERYTLLYLVGQGAFQPGRDEMNTLYTYLRDGGTVLMEGCRRQVATGDSPADAALTDLLASLGIRLQAAPPGHSLLTEPHLFGAPPPGYEIEGEPRLLLGEGVILSQRDYGCLWLGERRGRPAAREEIRTAMEWGENLVAHALARRSQARSI